MTATTAQAPGHAGFTEFFDAHVEYVWRSLIRLGASPADAEDLCQEVFLVVHARWPSLVTDRSLKPWLFAVARNVLRDHRRLARTSREIPDADADEERSDPGVRAYEAATVVRRALLRLPEPVRAVVVLHDLDEVEMRDASEALGIPLDTAYGRLRRGRDLLRRAIREVEGGGA